jgi:two-component system, NarL family, response regulator DevR
MASGRHELARWPRMIRVAILDDHYAVRLGLEAALSSEPGMEAVGSATTAGELAPLLYKTSPDVVVVDYRLPDADGLTVCRQVKGEAAAPGVVLHSAFADDTLTIPAMLAGADAVVHKGAPGRELAEAIRTVAQGGTAIPPVDPDMVHAGGEVLEPEDLPILSMLASGTPRVEIADALRMDATSLQQRMDRMLEAMRSPTQAASTG